MPIRYTLRFNGLEHGETDWLWQAGDFAKNDWKWKKEGAKTKDLIHVWAWKERICLDFNLKMVKRFEHIYLHLFEWLDQTQIAHFEGIDTVLFWGRIALQLDEFVYIGWFNRFEEKKIKQQQPPTTFTWRIIKSIVTFVFFNILQARPA